MGMISCELHGWRGVASMTPTAAKAFDEQKEMEPIVLVELVFDEVVPFFLYALKAELPFEKTKWLGQTYSVDSEEVLDAILGILVPRCGACVNQALK
ncbi:hypothetical protein [Pseudoduganella lutea]|uniref:Uncharacterized protein n=1 Tax=Pseudoduganella lutea TaxID=321985 RepID=A0A4P6KXB7_9BURK|nr:hypothetical protein [Pseudoduganella lutea]QBE63630.1 hypothetical protein EWM63_12130 [Pseudoduganella lutea]